MPLHWSYRQKQLMERGGRVVSTVCEYCNEVVLREMVLKDGSQQMLRSTIDHILPKHSGGTDERYNLKMACLWCNNGKEIADDCIAAFRCIEAIIGRDNTSDGFSKIALWFNDFRKKHGLVGFNAKYRAGFLEKRVTENV